MIRSMGGRPDEYAAPVPLNAKHRHEDFDCGELKLNHWLATYALDNEGVASRTYVITTLQNRASIVAYYSLATGGVSRSDIPTRLRHNLPDPVPAMILGRLAVDRRHGRYGVGREMLREALTQTADVSRVAGVRMLIVHAINEEAAGFYMRFGFVRFPGSDQTLCLPIESILASQ